MRFFRSIAVYLVVLAVALVATALWLYVGGLPVSADKTVVKVSIPRGASAHSIADSLAEQGLVRNEIVFLLTCRATGSADKLKPGVYGLSQSMKASQIVNKLVDGDTLESSVLIKEGYTIRQIADTLEEEQFVSGDVFSQIALTQGYQFPKYRFVRGNSLEGYLFPDTYTFAKDTDSNAIIEKMLETFNTKVMGPNRFLITDVAQKRLGVPRESVAEAVHKILTLASLVEREARTEEDCPLVAAVMWNRLAKNMRLEVDATVSYVPGQSRANIPRTTYAHTREESPYNTYRHGGLPPGPICSPGTAAIEAVLKPANADFLYYVARKNGSHIFTRTYKEHLAAKKSVQGK